MWIRELAKIAARPILDLLDLAPSKNEVSVPMKARKAGKMNVKQEKTLFNENSALQKASRKEGQLPSVGSPSEVICQPILALTGPLIK